MYPLDGTIVEQKRRDVRRGALCLHTCTEQEAPAIGHTVHGGAQATLIGVHQMYALKPTSY